jgi:acyl transferase domain-containing protein
MKQLFQEPEQILLEVGPGQALARLVTEHPNKVEHQIVLFSLDPAQDDRSDLQALLATLSQLWLAGVRVDWYGFHAHEHRHRLPLPTYPFERKRFWIEPRPPGAEGIADEVRGDDGLSTQKLDIADWFYLPSWKRSLLPIQPGTVPDPSCWLLFVDEEGIGLQLAQRLEQVNQRVIIVAVGTEFTRLNDGTFTLNPGQRSDYDALLKELDTLQMLPQKIVHLWSIMENGENDRDVRERGFYSLVFMAQALAEKRLTDEVQITAVSNNVQEVETSDVLCPEKALMLGPVKVISQEYPNITCRSIDIALLPLETRPEHQLIDYLWAELTGGSTDVVVAYRGSHRWTQTFEPVRLSEAGKASSRLQEGGVYLILGGLEGIGLILAEHLAQTVKAKLVLTRDPGSSVPKPPGLEAWGAEVLLIDVDVTDQLQMAKALKQVEERFGQLNGVIYAASGFGRAEIRLIEEMDKAKCEQQFRTAMDGLRALAQILSERELDFCLLISSLSSVLGGLGLVIYAATHNLVDAWAHRNNRTSMIPWISVNWDNWKLAGENRPKLGGRLDDLAIRSTEGVEAFERILSCGEASQLVVSTVDLQARIEQWITREPARESDEPEKERQVEFHARPNLLTPYVAPRNEVEQTLVDIWQDLVGIGQVGVHDNFFELGGDSLLAVQVITRAREKFEIDLPLSNLFEQPTVAFLADYIETIRWAVQDQAAFTQEDDREEIKI